MDVFEHLIMLMIIRREVIHFAMKNQLNHLLGAPDDNEAEEEDDEDSSLNTTFLTQFSGDEVGVDNVRSINIKGE
jgi:hypothetical protein